MADAPIAKTGSLQSVSEGVRNQGQDWSPGLVSVVVPIYGVEDYLERCLDSLLGQTYRRLELILVDDGSPDRCGAICDAYASRDQRIRVIHQQNAGVSAARNNGLGSAGGEFLMFVDPDDWVHTDLVEHLVEVASTTHADLTVCGFVRVSDGDQPSLSAQGDVDVMNGFEALHLYAGTKAGLMTAPWGKLYRRHLYEHIEFPVGRRYEDDFTTYRVVAGAGTVAVSSRELYFYFVRPTSATLRPQHFEGLLDRAEALMGQARFFDGLGVLDSSRASYKKAFLIYRQVRGDVLASGRDDLIAALRSSTKEAARSVTRNDDSFSMRLFARIYPCMPAVFDGGIALRRRAVKLLGSSMLKTD